MADKLRLAVIGVGYLGRFHALIYSRLPGVELVGVVDEDQNRAREVAREAGCAAFADVMAIMDRVDAVSVVVPTTAHLAVAEPLLRRGIHLLLEKPIAATREEGERIVQLADQGGAILQIGHLERFNAGVMALAEHIDRPRFVETQRMGEFVERATDVDVVSDLMIHDIDIILSLMGSELKSVSAIGTPVLTDRVDIANARLEFANGCVANLTASRICVKSSRKLRFFQRDGYLSIDLVNHRIARIDRDQDKPCGPIPGMRTGEVTVPPGDALKDEIAAFVAAVAGRRTPEVTGQMGRDALRVALRIDEQIRRTNRRNLS